MRLHENKELFRQALEATANYMNIPAIYIEKDYWVCFALHLIFNNEIGKDTVFKGGTSLSKCFGLIERFSEDIDMVILQDGSESSNLLKKKIKKVTEAVAKFLPEVEEEGITVKMGMNRKTAHKYEQIISGNFGQVRKVIIVEATWLGYFEPYTQTTVHSYVYDMMVNQKQETLAKEYGLLPFEVNVLSPKRTICEKIMSLVRFSYSYNPITDLQKKIRHTYDLHQLLQDKELSNFFESDEFIKMLLKVGQDDVSSYKNDNKWLINHPVDCLLFSKLENTWNNLKPVYTAEFKNLVFGHLPDEKEVYTSLKRVRNRIEKIDWTITINE